MQRARKMKLRHAAAMVLTGWLLMTPPPMKDAFPVFDVTAPLSQWNAWSGGNADYYASKRECEDSRRQQCSTWLFHDSPVGWGYQCIRAAGVAVCASVCLPSDDPRLKK